MDIVSKVALNKGMSIFVFVVYRHAVAFLVIGPFAIIFEREVRPKMSLLTFGKLMLLGLLEPVIGQILYFLGMKYTTATFAAVITFLMAFVFGLENVQLTSIRSQAKIIGTIATVAGAMIMTSVRGPAIGLPWTKGRNNHEMHQHNGVTPKHSIKGSIMITIGCFSWALSLN